MRGHFHHSHIDIWLFVVSEDNSSVNGSPSTAYLADTTVLTSATASLESMNGSSVRRIIYLSQAHVCVNPSFSVIRTLLVRKKLWNENIQNYLVKMMN